MAHCTLLLGSQHALATAHCPNNDRALVVPSSVHTEAPSAAAWGTSIECRFEVTSSANSQWSTRRQNAVCFWLDSFSLITTATTTTELFVSFDDILNYSERHILERVKWKAHTFLGNHSSDHFPSHEEGFQRDNSATRCASLPRHTTLHTRREAHTAWVKRAQREQVKTITPWLITSSTLAGEQDNRTCHRTHANCRPETLSLRWRMISSRSLLSFILPAQLITTVFSAVVHSLLHTSFACTEFSRLVLL